jgi:chemotaxis protein methyltransferase CheR
MSIVDSGVGLEYQEVLRFRDALENCLGLQFEESKSHLLAEVLVRRSFATHQSSSAYVDLIVSRRPRGELAELARELTVPETYFFRNIDQFRALAECVIPERMKKRSAERKLRVLSAGCASGEEAYTIAILIRDLVEPGWNASIVAADLNPSVLQKARKGQFSPWSLRETPLPVQERWFRKEGPDVVLDDEIKSMVHFEQHNLAEDDGTLWEKSAYDVIFCRNVMMYFAPTSAGALIGRITRSLASTGFLFLGHAETLRGISDDFQLCHTHGTFYYRRRSDDGCDVPLEIPSLLRNRPVVEQADTWIEVIRSASERIQVLASSTRSSGSGSRSMDPPDTPKVSVVDAIERLKDEQFIEALEILESLSRHEGDDPQIMLVQAAAAVQAGLLDMAEGACRRLLQVEAFAAASHYAMALCREAAGDVEAALEHDDRAIVLDPGFAMPHLHRGLLARNTHDLGIMRSELTAAAELLESEDMSRIVLFGGGFTRDALIAICQAQLTDPAVS